MSTTIRRNSKQIPALKEQLTRCQVYTLENYFEGQPVEPRYAWAALERSPHARLTDNGNGRYTVHVHSNRWYELWRPAGEEDTT